ncbi:MAG: hypothetical protein EAY75_07405 [Bacteroidetes bacterium]|nr:MAG: hypothetical protein EAY75_07405 [Bacteroidota bacterium]
MLNLGKKLATQNGLIYQCFGLVVIYLYRMKKWMLLYILASTTAITAQAQSEKFGLLSFTVPVEWQQQSRQGMVRYEWYDRKTNLGGQLTVWMPVAAAPKPDSSFRRIWRSSFDSANGNLPVPTVIKRRFTPSGISYYEAIANLGTGVDFGYRLFWVFHLGGQAQTMVFATTNAAALKAQQQTVTNFLESIYGPDNPLERR